MSPYPQMEVSRDALGRFSEALSVRFCRTGEFASAAQYPARLAGLCWQLPGRWKLWLNGELKLHAPMRYQTTR